MNKIAPSVLKIVTTWPVYTPEFLGLSLIFFEACWSMLVTSASRINKYSYQCFYSHVTVLLTSQVNMLGKNLTESSSVNIYCAIFSGADGRGILSRQRFQQSFDVSAVIICPRLDVHCFFGFTRVAIKIHKCSSHTV